MIDPIGMQQGILNRILDRIPAGRDVIAHMRERRMERANSMRSQEPEQEIQTSRTVDRQPAVAFIDMMQNMAQDIPNNPLRQAIEAEIEIAARTHGIDANLIRAVIRAESSYRPDAVSRAGAMGLMQLMPGTAASLGVTDPFDIRQNIDAGTRYLVRQLERFNGDLSLALAAYNAGPNAVIRHGGIPPFPETQNHVPRVLRFFDEYVLRQYQQAQDDSRPRG